MDTNSALQFLNSEPDPATTIAPKTAAAALSVADLQHATGLEDFNERKRQEYLHQNQIDGVPIDLESEASGFDRLMLSFRTAKENQVSYLKKRYGDENVRTDSNGEILFRVADSETGKPKDIPLDMNKITGKDAIDLIGAAPEIIGGLYATKKGQVLPWLKNLKGMGGVARDILTSTVGAETAGAFKDIGANLVDRGEVNLGEVATDRAKSGLVDIGVGALSFPAARFIKMMENPLAGSRGKIQFDALEAQKYFKEKYGVDVPLSIGESTGSPFMQRTEVFMEKMPGATTPFKELKGKQETELRKLQSMMMGRTPESDEQIGNRLMEVIQKKAEGLESGVESARKGLATEAQAGIESLVSGLTIPERQLYKTQVGKEVREAVIAKRDAAKLEGNRLYEIAKSMPGGQGKEFSGMGLKDDFKKILGELPSAENVTEVPTGILDVTGKPIVRTETGKKLMKEFVPPNILARLKSVTELKDPKFSLSDLQQMRREVYDDIAKGEGVPGLGTHYLADIGKTLTKAIESGVDALPTGDLKVALQAANEHYKNKVVPFNRSGITELFRNADEAGNVSDSQIVSRILGGDRAVENYKLLKETIGETSPQFLKLKRSLVDNILESSRLPGEETIDAKSLMKNLNQFRLKHREISDDVFGKTGDYLFRNAKALDFAQGTEIPADELKKLMATKDVTADKIQKLINVESEKSEAYRNQMFKDIKDGKVSGDFNPEDFVNRFVSKSASTDVSKVMDMIKGDPSLVEDTRTKMIEKLFRDSARSAQPQDISQLLSGDPTRIMSGTGLFKSIENPVVRRKLETILGKDTFNDLLQYIKLEASTEAKETSFKAAGGIAAGTQIANLTRRGPLAYLTGAAKDFVVASLLTRKPLLTWLTSVPKSEPGAVYALFSNPSFLQAVTKEFGEGTGAEAFITSLKSSADKWFTEEMSKSKKQEDEKESTETRQKALQFLNSGQSSMTPARP